MAMQTDLSSSHKSEIWSPFSDLVLVEKNGKTVFLEVSFLLLFTYSS